MLYLPERGSDNMLIDYEVMGQRLRNARKEKGFSQTIASEKLDISIAYLSRIERGKAQVNLKRLVEMCSLYETSISEMLTGVEKQKKEYRRLISYLNLFGKDRVCTVLQPSSTFPQWGYKEVVNNRDFQKTRMNTDPSSAF